MNLGVISMKEYSTLTRSSILVPFNQLKFSVIHKTSFFGGDGGSYLSSGYSKPHHI